MNHRDLSKITTSIPLWPAQALAESAQNKLNRRPISTSKRGLIKCSGKDGPAKVAFIRSVNLDRMNAAR